MKFHDAKAAKLIEILEADGKNPAAMSNSELLRYRGLGPKTVRNIRAMLEQQVCPKCGEPLSNNLRDPQKERLIDERERLKDLVCQLASSLGLIVL